MRNLTYPLTQESFIEYQKGLTQRDLSEDRIELLRLTIDNINAAYETGRKGGVLFPATAKDIMEVFTQMDELEKLKDPAIQRFFASLLIWLHDAYEAGQEDRARGGGVNDAGHYTTARGDEGGRADPAVCCGVVGEIGSGSAQSRKGG